MGDNKTLVHMSMSTCERNNPGSRVALYLDESMVGPDREHYLPVMAIEGSPDYALFIPEVQEAVAGFFGASLQDAQATVGQINAERGMTHEDVMDLVGASMALAAARRR